MIDSQVVAFTVIAAALTLTPGADTMLVVRNVLRGGHRDGIVGGAGHTLAGGCLLLSIVERAHLVLVRRDGFARDDAVRDSQVVTPMGSDGRVRVDGGTPKEYSYQCRLHPRNS